MDHQNRIKQSEAFQLLLLDGLYALSGSEKIVFQGGTALRWVYGGARYSEDLDFVTDLTFARLKGLLETLYKNVQSAATAQFGPGILEYNLKETRSSAIKSFYIFRPQRQRERIAVKLEFERLRAMAQPQCNLRVLRDLPQVAGLVAAGRLYLPHTSAIIVVETLEELLSDKIRSLFERTYIKGRDVYDFWWMTQQLNISVAWENVRHKLSMYRVPFVPARKPCFFQSKEGRAAVKSALESDLPRFLPSNVFELYQQSAFDHMIKSLCRLSVELVEQNIIQQPLDTETDDTD